MEDLRKRLFKIEERTSYLSQIKDGVEWGNLSGLREKFVGLRDRFYDYTEEQLSEEIRALEDSLSFLEARGEETLTSMDRVRIVRNPHRFSLKDILENVYEDYTELGGAEEVSIDPSMVAARASIMRRLKNNKSVMQQVMVIGHEKGHGEEYRNGGCSKPWGNEKALRYMKVAETEGIPIHFYIFTPGSFPVEDYPGAGQQIARNLYAMAKLRVPMISVTSEGGSGGAEAVGLADARLMFSHGYYSVISPEGAAAIEGKIREGEKMPKELVEDCAERLHITAAENLKLGTIDRIIQEPLLGAKRDDFAFFRQLKSEIIRATDEVVLKTKSLRAFRAYELTMQKAEEQIGEDPNIVISWDLNEDEVKRLLLYRSKKYRAMSCKAYLEEGSACSAFYKKAKRSVAKLYYSFRYDLLKSQQKQVKKVLQDVSGEGSVLLRQVSSPISAAYDFIARKPGMRSGKLPVAASGGGEDPIEFGDVYTSPMRIGQ